MLTLRAFRPAAVARLAHARSKTSLCTLEANFNKNHFSRAEQEKYVSGNVLDNIEASAAAGKPVAPQDADAFARGLLVWGQERGARYDILSVDCDRWRIAASRAAYKGFLRHVDVSGTTFVFRNFGHVTAVVTRFLVLFSIVYMCSCVIMPVCSHFAHWFHPLTGGSAQKHLAFFKRRKTDVISHFTGKMLAISEPDGSSFPNGDLRMTHEARGYTGNVECLVSC